MSKNIVKNKFFEFLNKKIDIKEFENWIYISEELRDLISEEEYFNLISFDYRSRDLKYFISNIFFEYFDEKDYEYYKIMEMLTGALEEDKIMITLLTESYHLYFECHQIFGNLAFKYGSSFIDLEYNETGCILTNKEEKIIEENRVDIHNEIIKIILDMLDFKNNNI